MRRVGDYGTNDTIPAPVLVALRYRQQMRCCGGCAGRGRRVGTRPTASPTSCPVRPEVSASSSTGGQQQQMRRHTGAERVTTPTTLDLESEGRTGRLDLTAACTVSRAATRRKRWVRPAHVYHRRSRRGNRKNGAWAARDTWDRACKIGNELRCEKVILIRSKPSKPTKQQWIDLN